MACRMMDFNGSLSAAFEIQSIKETSLPLYIRNVQCFGNESSIFACAHKMRGSHEDCPDNKIALTLCKERKGQCSFNKCFYVQLL